MDPARPAPQPQIKAAKNRGILTAKYANHAKKNAAERGFAILTAGNGERDMTSFLVPPSVLMQAILCQENKDLCGCSTDEHSAADVATKEDGRPISLQETDLQ